MGQQSNTAKNTSTSQKNDTTVTTDSFDFSKAEETIRNYELANSHFTMKWEKNEGFSIGLENYRVSGHYETANEALATIGYKSEKDRDGEDILLKIGEVNYEFIILCMKILMGIEKINQEEANRQYLEEQKKTAEELIKKIQNNG